MLSVDFLPLWIWLGFGLFSFGLGIWYYGNVNLSEWRSIVKWVLLGPIMLVALIIEIFKQ